MLATGLFDAAIASCNVYPYAPASRRPLVRVVVPRTRAHCSLSVYYWPSAVQHISLRQVHQLHLDSLIYFDSFGTNFLVRGLSSGRQTALEQRPSALAVSSLLRADIGSRCCCCCCSLRAHRTPCCDALFHFSVLRVPRLAPNLVLLVGI